MPVGLCGELMTMARVREETLRLHFVPVDAVVGRTERGEHRDAAAQRHGRHVGIVDRLKQQDFVARMHERGERREEAFGRAGGHRDLGDRVVAAAVQLLDLRRERLAQREHAGHRRVLVVPLAHVARDGVDQLGRRIEVGKPLRQIDRADLVGQARHDREDADAARRELRRYGSNLGHGGNDNWLVVGGRWSWSVVDGKEIDQLTGR